MLAKSYTLGGAALIYYDFINNKKRWLQTNASEQLSSGSSLFLITTFKQLNNVGDYDRVISTQVTAVNSMK